MPNDEIQRFVRVCLRFRRRAEQKITIDGNACAMERPERSRGFGKIDAFGEGIQNSLMTGFHAELQHRAAAFFQRPAKILIRQMPRCAGKAVPGRTGRIFDQRLQERGRNRAVQKMNQGRLRLSRKRFQFRRGAGGRQRPVGICFRLFRAERTFSPPAALGRAVGQDKTGRKISVFFQQVIIGRGAFPARGHAQQRQEFFLPRSFHHSVNQAGKQIRSPRKTNPGSCERSAQENFLPRMNFFDEADHGHGAERLA